MQDESLCELIDAPKSANHVAADPGQVTGVGPPFCRLGKPEKCPDFSFLAILTHAKIVAASTVGFSGIAVAPAEAELAEGQRLEAVVATSGW
jgi:hypothetical protein